MMRRLINIIMVGVASLTVAFSCVSERNKKLKRVQSQISINENDTCIIEDFTEVNLFIFSNKAEDAEINCSKKLLGKFELLGHSQNNYHYVVTIKKDEISDPMIVNNFSKNQSISIPFKKEYDAISIDWRDSAISINYGKSCSFIK